MKLATMRQTQLSSSSRLLQSSASAVPVRPAVGVVCSRSSSRRSTRSSTALEANSPYNNSNGWTPYPPDNPDMIDRVEQPTAKDPPTFSEVMGFSGAPEVINGRLAMLGFVSALAAEYTTGKSVPQQISQAPVPVAFAALTFVGASLVAAFAQKKGIKPVSFGPFTPDAERLNARVGMLGFTLLVALELSRGAALLSGVSS